MTRFVDWRNFRAGKKVRRYASVTTNAHVHPAPKRHIQTMAIAHAYVATKELRAYL